MIELVKPAFIAGNEKKFSDFVKKIDNEKVAVISHNDLDGISSAKVVNSVVNANFIRLVNYEDINDKLLDELKKKKITKVIFSDLFMPLDFIKKLEKFSDVLIIDHHKFQHDFNSDKTVFLNAQGFCAAYLCYYLFSKIKDIEKLDWLIACACVADFCHVAPEKWLSLVYEKYGDVFERDGSYVRKTGKIWDTQWKIALALVYFHKDVKKVFDAIGDKFGDIGDVAKHAEEVNSYIKECLERFEKEKENIEGGYFWEFTPRFKVGSIISTIASSPHPDKTVIVARMGDDAYHFSARRQDKRADMDLLLKKLIAGLKDADAGGHVAAAGGHVSLMDRKEFRKRLGLR